MSSGLKFLLRTDELSTLLFWRDVVAETIATGFMLVFVMFSAVSLDLKLFEPNPATNGLMIGLVIFYLIEAFRPISGGHLNPAVSMAGVTLGRITLVRGKLS